MREGQPRWLSLVEQCLSTAIGFIVALVTQLVVFPIFEIETSTEENLLIAGAFTVVSVIRGYFVRRFFN